MVKAVAVPAVQEQTAERESSVPAVVERTFDPPSFLEDIPEELVGLGNSSDPSDQSLPFISILQSNSPQVKEENAKFVAGAKPGYIFNTGSKQFWPARVTKGEDGVLIVPCGYRRKWVEWKPSRGGFVQNYDFSIDLLRTLGAKKTRVVIEGKEREVITVPCGNLLVETAYTFMLINGTPAVLGASSTALGSMRDWMNYRNSLRRNGKILPSFAKTYRLQTVLQTKDQNSWYNWKVVDVDWVRDRDVWELAKDFAIAVERDEVQIGRPDYFEDSADAPHSRSDVPVSDCDDSIPV